MKLKTETAQSSWHSVLMPWVLVPLLFFLAWKSPKLAKIIHFDPNLLMLPVAAWLGARYGGRGLAAIVLTGLFFIPSFSGYFGVIGGRTDILICSLIIAYIAADKRSFTEFLSSRFVSLQKYPVILAVMLFGSHQIVAFRGQDPETGIYFQFSTAWIYLFFLYVFFLGAKDCPWRRFLVCLTAVLAIGFALKLTGLHIILFESLIDTGAIRKMGPFIGPVGKAWSFKAGLFSVSLFIAAIICFEAGRFISREMRGDDRHGWFWKYPIAVTAALVLFSVWPWSLGCIPTGYKSIGRVCILGSPLILPVAGFVIGWTSSRRGILMFTLAFFVLYCGISLLLFASMKIYSTVNLASILIVFGFAVLGFKTRFPGKAFVPPKFRDVF